MAAIDLTTLKAGDLIRATRDAYGADAAMPPLKAGTVWEVASVHNGRFHLKGEAVRCFSADDDFEQIWPGDTARKGDTIELIEDCAYCWSPNGRPGPKGSRHVVDTASGWHVSWVPDCCPSSPLHNHYAAWRDGWVVVERAPAPEPKPNARDAKVGDLVRPLKDFRQSGESFREDTLYLVYASYFLKVIGVRTSTRPRGTYADADRFEIVVRATPKPEPAPKPEPKPCKHKVASKRLSWDDDRAAYVVTRTCLDCEMVLGSHTPTDHEARMMADDLLRTHGVNAFGDRIASRAGRYGALYDTILDAQDYVSSIKARS